MTPATASIPFRLGTFSAADGIRYAGIVAAGRVLPLQVAAECLALEGARLQAPDSILGLLEHWERNLPLLEKAVGLIERNGDFAQDWTPVENLCVHPPVDLPRQVYCSGANYKRHVVELIMAQIPESTESMTAEQRREFAENKMDQRAATGTPFCFVKSQSSITGPFDPVILPQDTAKPDWELELAAVIGRKARRVSREHALDYVAGYTIANDITSRDKLVRAADDMRDMGLDWTAAKCSPTYLPLGPYLTPAGFIDDPQQLQITLRLNGEVMQDESTADMIFGVARLVEHLSSLVELQPGDVICTGSPAGNGVHYGRFLRPGDIVEGTISGLGSQRNTCVAETV